MANISTAIGDWVGSAVILLVRWTIQVWYVPHKRLSENTGTLQCVPTCACIRQCMCVLASASIHRNAALGWIECRAPLLTELEFPRHVYP